MKLLYLLSLGAAAVSAMGATSYLLLSNSKVSSVNKEGAKATQTASHPLGISSTERFSTPSVMEHTPVSLPWSVDFSQIDDLSGFTVIDANGDGTTWTTDGTTAYVGYNARENMDDWLITPSLYLEGGRAYRLGFGASPNDDTYDERLEVWFGQDPAVVAMTNEILPPTVLHGVAVKHFEEVFVPSSTGTYYIGFHGISDPDQYRLHLSYINVEAAAEGNTPAGVSDLTVTTDGTWSLTARLSMTLPDLTVSGQSLSSIQTLKIERNGQTVKTLSDLVPGQQISITDEVPSAGEYTYSVTAVNEEGEGLKMSATAFIGAAIPGKPENIVLSESGTGGRISLKWDPVTKDIDGCDIPAGKVAYTIVDDEGYVIADGWTSTQFTETVDDEVQKFLQYLVIASTAAGYGEPEISNMLAVGPAYTDFHESFADGTLSYIMGVGYAEGEVDWDIAGDSTFDGISSSDGDNGFAYMETEYAGATAGLFTGKIKLPAQGAAICFDVFNIGSAEFPNHNVLDVEVSEDGLQWHRVASMDITEMCGDGYYEWSRVTAGLYGYDGKTVQVKFQPHSVNYGYFLIDNIAVSTLVSYNLAARDIAAPATAHAGELVDVSVSLANTGALPAEGHVVTLYADSKPVSSVEPASLLPGQKQTVTVPYRVSAVADAPVSLYAVVEFEKDADPADNATQQVVIEPYASKLPPVGDLDGSVDDADRIHLTWSEPFTATFTPGIYEDFESADDFSSSYGDWTMVDVDGMPVGGVAGTEIPGIEPGVTTASFFVVNSSLPQFNYGFAPHSGVKYMAAMFRDDNGQTDDWLITPRLNGASQVISFYARSLEEYYAEKIEILYSLGSLKPKDFISITTVDRVPGRWTEYNIPVPNGTRYFAIRSCAQASFMLLVDDFYYADETSPIGIETTGYNVYCDGIRLNEEPLTAPGYEFAAPSGTHDYRVSTLYGEYGESSGSNTVTLTTEGSGMAYAQAYPVIKVVAGGVAISSCNGLSCTVHAADGTLLHHAERMGASHFVALPAGLYIVSAANHTAKILVK